MAKKNLEDMAQEFPGEENYRAFSRRQFLGAAGSFSIALGVGGCSTPLTIQSEGEETAPSSEEFSVWGQDKGALVRLGSPGAQSVCRKGAELTDSLGHDSYPSHRWRNRIGGMDFSI